MFQEVTIAADMALRLDRRESDRNRAGKKVEGRVRQLPAGPRAQRPSRWPSVADAPVVPFHQLAILTTSFSA